MPESASSAKGSAVEGEHDVRAEPAWIEAAQLFCQCFLCGEGVQRDRAHVGEWSNGVSQVELRVGLGISVQQCRKADVFDRQRSARGRLDDDLAGGRE